MAEATVLLLPLDVGNKSGTVGCGAWNNNCGGIDMVTVWQASAARAHCGAHPRSTHARASSVAARRRACAPARRVAPLTARARTPHLARPSPARQVAYCIIAALIVVVFPFFIFYYENDDEGMEAKEKSEGSCLMACWLRFEACRRSFWVALGYTALTLALGCIAFFVLQYYIAFTQIPYSLVTVSVATSAFQPVGTPLDRSTPAACAAGAAVCPCGLPGGCVPSAATLRMDVSLVIFLAAVLSFAGWFVFSIYVGIGFIALPIDCFNAYIHRPKVLSVTEARTQRRVLMKRSEELIKIGDEMAARVIDAQDSARNKKEKRGAAKVAKTEINRFKLLVDLLEKDLEEFQLGDPQNYRQHYNPLVPYMKLVAGVVSVLLSAVWVIHIVIYMLFSPPLHPFLNQCVPPRGDRRGGRRLEWRALHAAYRPLPAPTPAPRRAGTSASSTPSSRSSGR